MARLRPADMTGAYQDGEIYDYGAATGLTVGGGSQWIAARYKNTTGQRIKITKAMVGVTGKTGENGPLVDFIVGTSSESYVKTNVRLTEKSSFQFGPLYCPSNCRGKPYYLDGLSVEIPAGATFYVGVRRKSDESIFLMRYGRNPYKSEAGTNLGINHEIQSAAPNFSDANWWNNHQWHQHMNTNVRAGTHVLYSYVDWQPAYKPTTDISVSPSTLLLWTGDSQGLTATVSPSDASNKTVTWRSEDAKVCTVSANGVVTAVKSGKAKVYAKAADGQEKYCSVTVRQHPTSLTLSGLEKDWAWSGDRLTISSVVEPDDAYDKSVVYSLTDTDIASIGKDGVLGIAPILSAQKFPDGTANLGISAKTVDGEIESNLLTLDVYQHVISLALSCDHSTILYCGDTAKLTPEIEPENSKYKSVSFSSNKPEILSIKADGTMEACGKLPLSCTSGEAMVVITATLEEPLLGGKTFSKQMTFRVRQPATKVTCSVSSNILYTDRGVQESTLSYTVYPENAYNKSVVIKNQNPEYFLINDNLICPAISAIPLSCMTGEVSGKITVTSKSNDNISATANISLRQNVTGISILSEKEVYSDHKPIQMELTITPTNAYDKKVSYISLNTSACRVDSTGLVTFINPLPDGFTNGFALVIIRATSNDGGLVSNFTILIKQGANDLRLTSNTDTLYTHIDPRQTRLFIEQVPSHSVEEKILVSSSASSLISVSGSESKWRDLMGGIQVPESVAADGCAAITITAKIERTGKTVSKTFYLRQNVTGIALTPASISDDVGTVHNLTALISPTNAADPRISWNVSDSKALILEEDTNLLRTDRNVRINYAGEEFVYATTMDGTNLQAKTSVEGKVPCYIGTGNRVQKMWIYGNDLKIHPVKALYSVDKNKNIHKNTKK